MGDYPTLERQLRHNQASQRDTADAIRELEATRLDPLRMTLNRLKLREMDLIRRMYEARKGAA